MSKVIAAFNMTLDGICDHTTGVADAALHQHFAKLIDRCGLLLYGRTTFLLMKFWQALLHHPSGEKAMDEFAVSIDAIEKLVFSNTLKDTGWESATLAGRPLVEEVSLRRQQAGKSILIGSRSLIIQLLNEHLVDEFQICIHPVIERNGLNLFEQITGQIQLNLMEAKTLGSGVVVLTYEPVKP